jgi:oligopeptide transport system ATP-binding protein
MAEAAVSGQPALRPSGAKTLLRAENVVKHFPAGLGATVRAVDGVSFEIREGETLGLVGESGCGKSTLARLVTQLLPVTSGKIFFGDVELTRLRGEKLRQHRRQLQMIFQDPFASLDPRMTVGDIIAEPLDNFRAMRGRKRSARVQQLLEIVGLNPNFNNRYPHEFSGGQRQRIGIARALALNPALVVCDEAISALDVSIQAQIVNLLEDLQREFKLTYLFIAHDLSVVRHISDRVMVMYLGKIVEIADSTETYSNPKHPYTKALLSAIPVPDPKIQRGRRLVELTGEIPSPIKPPPGCRFHTRCPIARVPTPCAEVEPPLEEKLRGHLAACHFSQDV